MNTVADDSLPISIEMDNSLKITLDFGGENRKYTSQFATYLKTYDIRDLRTFVNIKRWARSRNIPYTIKVHGIFNVWAWLFRIFLSIDNYLDKRGEGYSPVKWEK